MLFFENFHQLDNCYNSMNRKGVWNNWTLQMRKNKRSLEPESDAGVRENDKKKSRGIQSFSAFLAHQSSSSTSVSSSSFVPLASSALFVSSSMETVNQRQLQTSSFSSSSSSGDFPNTAINIVELLNFAEKYNLPIRNSRFLHQLKSATRDGRVLTFCDAGMNPGQLPRFDHQLFIFREYEALFDKIWGKCCENRRNNLTATDVLVLGNAGIGKTMFGLYVMWRLALLNIPFMYEASLAQIKLFVDNYEFDLTRFHAVSLMDERPFYCKVVYLTDLDSNNEPTTAINYACAICFAFPNPRRYHNFRKGEYAETFYMKIPSNREVREMKSSLESFQNLEDTVFEEQLARYGPIPRFVLDWCAKGESLINEALACKGMQMMEILGGMAPLTGKDENISHVLVHMDTKDNLTFFYRAASRYITQKVVEEVGVALPQALLMYMRNPDKSLLGFCGDLFDIIGPLTFLPNSIHSVRPLTDGHCIYGDFTARPAADLRNRTIRLKEARSLSVDWFTKDFTIDRRVLYSQGKRTEKSIDAFSVSEKNRLFLFQLHVSKHHPLLGSGLERVIHRVEKLTGIVFGKKVYLVFVTLSSSESVRINKIQPLKTTINQREEGERVGNVEVSKKKYYSQLQNIPEKIRHLATEQYVIHIADRG